MLLWQQWDPVHMPRDPGGISPTCTMSNRQMDLSPGCGPCSGLHISSGLSVAFWEPLESAVLDCYPQIREPLWKSGSTGEKFRHTVRERGNKKTKTQTQIECSEEGKRNNLTLLMWLLPHRGTVHCQRRLLGPTISTPSGESVRAWEYMHLVPQLCGMLPKVPISPLPQSEYWYRGVFKAQRGGDTGR